MAESAASSRIEMLMQAMTLEEKLGQLTMRTAHFAVTGPDARAVPLADIRAGRVGSLINLVGAEETREAQRVALDETRLGIPLFFAFDVVHGHRTIFPVPLGEAAAFNPVLWEQTARCAAEEAAEDGLHLTFAPSLDVCRDPRWGRIVEGPGEDPYLAGRFARAKVKGFQTAELDAPGAVAATAKHFAGYGAVTAGRDYAQVDISERAFRETYAPPFHEAVEAGVAAIMPAFTDLSAIPLTANVAVLRDLLRGKWGFDGVIISDYTAIAELQRHGVARDIVEAAALALRAGVDIDLMADAYLNGLPAALQSGRVTMAEIDASVRRVLELKARLGLFERPPRGHLPAASPATRKARRDLAREAARRAIVLLTNQDEFLPLQQPLRRIALVGPLADAPEEMIGPWCAAGETGRSVGLREGLSSALPAAEIEAAQGVPVEGGGAGGVVAAVELAHWADVVVLFLGESRAMSGEAASRAHPDLPGHQEDLARAVLAAGKPTILVLASGRPLILPGWLVDEARAVLATWFLGNEAGHAIADVLTGAYNPSGRLPVSWPVDVGQIPIFFGARPTGRPADQREHYTSKYLDMPVEPLFPFGHGHSYTKFSLTDLRLTPAKMRAGDRVTVTVDVANEGKMAGDATIFLFIRDRVASVSRPLLELRNFSQVSLAAGAKHNVEFTLVIEDVTFLDARLEPRFESGIIDVAVGLSAAQGTLLRRELDVVEGSAVAEVSEEKMGGLNSYIKNNQIDSGINIDLLKRKRKEELRRDFAWRRTAVDVRTGHDYHIEVSQFLILSGGGAVTVLITLDQGQVLYVGAIFIFGIGIAASMAATIAARRGINRWAMYWESIALDDEKEEIKFRFHGAVYMSRLSMYLFIGAVAILSVAAAMVGIDLLLPLLTNKHS